MKNSQNFSHIINCQINFRNKLIDKKTMQNILNKCQIYDEINDINLYKIALTHKSYVISNNHKNLSNIMLNIEGKHQKDVVPFRNRSNERFEFLGDSIVNLIICEYLFYRYENKDEGFLTKLKTNLVDRKSLAKFCRYLDLSDYILMSNHMENIHGRNTDKILEDVFESLIYALNKDLGFNVVKKFVIYILEKTTNFAQILHDDKNYKDRILKYFQKNGWENPIYKTKYIIGQPHKRTFTVDLFVDKNKDKNLKYLSTGVGTSKKAAEQEASKYGLKYYNIF